MKKIVLFLLLTMVGHVRGMLSPLMQKNVIQVSSDQLLEQQRQLIKQEKFIKERRAFWKEYLRSIYGEMVNHPLVQNLVVRFAQRDWDHRNWSSNKLNQKFREGIKRTLY